MRINIRRKSNRRELKGSALIFTMFIMAGMLMVAMSGAYLILTGILAAGIQSQSTKAYFAAEAGAEYTLRAFRHEGAGEIYGIGNIDSGMAIIFFSVGDNSKVEVFHTSNPDTQNNYTSIGTFNNIKRSVEVSF